jgi:monofunctional biosynthetic peptidoglycan transglycosylase
MLPAPRRVDLSRPSSRLWNRALRLLDRMRDFGRIGAEEHLRASAELERILAGPRPEDDRAEPPDEEIADATAAAPPHPDPLPRLPPGERENGVTATPSATSASSPTSLGDPPR